MTSFKLDVLLRMNRLCSSRSPARCQLPPQWSRVQVCVSTHWCVFVFCFFSLFRLPVCQILPKGVVSVIGPASSPASGSTVSHICGEKEVSWKDKPPQKRHADVPVITCTRRHPALPSLQWLSYRPRDEWMQRFPFFPLPIKWTCLHFLTFIPSLPVCLCH